MKYQPGDKVTYVSIGQSERGVVKSLPGNNCVFVVYNCANNWDRYFDFTAARTSVSDLVPGWVEASKQQEVK